MPGQVMDKPVKVLKLNKSLLSIGILLLVLIGCGFLFIRPFTVSGKARQEVAQLHDQLRIGQPPSHVQTQILSGGYRYLKLIEISTNAWVVTTPLRFGAGNWVLFIDFDRSGVSSVRVRTADNRNVRPNGAPADKPATAD